VDQLSEFLIALLIAGWIGGFGLASARTAAGIERRPPVWFAVGAVLGPIALLVLRTAPPGRCRSCGTPTRGWHHICWWCHEDVRSTPASTVAILERMSARTSTSEELPPAPPPGRSEPARPFVIRTDPIGPTAADRVEPIVTSRPDPRPLATLATATPTPPTTSTRQPPTPDLAPSAPRAAVDRNGSSATSNDQPLRSASQRPGARAVEVPRVLATAVFVTGSARLQPGHRYSLALRSARFLVLGPSDVDPSAVVLDRDVADIEIRTVEGRLIVNEPRSRSGLVLAFMSVAGASPTDLASTITHAAQAAERR